MALNWMLAVLIAFIHVCVGTPWATPAQEALDEKHDAEIFRAVFDSMEQWQRRHNTTGSRRRRATAAGSEVCYEQQLGCFRDSGPFGYLDMLPASPDDIATRFLLYASHAHNAPPVDVPFNNISQVWQWAETSMNASAPTKVIVHGFGSDCDHVWVYEMKSALMAVENCNVICVDWGRGAATPNYVKASANTRLVGKQVALLLSGLAARGLRLDTTHVIGFSLGAHVAGFAGAELRNLSRITGLDPAGPLFESQDPRARLDSSDAHFVDVIHSNGETLILGGLGSWQPMGDVDFYPNGGRMQKGCSNLFVGAVTDILWSATEVEGRSLCNHRRAYKFFTDSLSPRCHFPAFPCESYDKFLTGGCFPCAGDRRCGDMGYYADRSAVRGTLYLITRDEEPFCAHQYHVRVESAASDAPAVSYGKIQVTLVGNADINETFTLTQKDDAEIRVGVPLTRIAVPHPALLEPRSVQLVYTAYSGWLSSGLARWPVDKLALTDSFGNSLSVCKKGLQLESGVPVTLPLFPGECNPPLDATTPTPTPTPTPGGNKTTTSLTASLLDMFRYKPTPVVSDENVGEVAGDEVVVVETLIGGVGTVGRRSNTSSIDNATAPREDSRSFAPHPPPLNTTLAPPLARPSHSPPPDTHPATPAAAEVREPVLKVDGFRARALANASDVTSDVTHGEVLEPVLKPTSPRPPMTSPNAELRPPPPGDTWLSWATGDVRVNKLAADAGENATGRGKGATVQLFPPRLAAILAQAERYARAQFAPTPFKMAATENKLAATKTEMIVSDSKVAATDGNKTAVARRRQDVEEAVGRRGKTFPAATAAALRLVAYSHAREQQHRYIPLSPEARGSEHE